jgi:SulP family sulfate permease
MKIVLFGGLRPFNLKAALRDVVAGVTLASMNIPQVLGYARIAGLPVVTGLYTVLLPILAFAVFGSSRHRRYGSCPGASHTLSRKPMCQAR